MGGKSSANSTAPGVAGYQVMSSMQSTPIPIIYGTNRTTGNLVWYGDFYYQETGAGKGGAGGANAGYTYWASCVLSVCEGPVNGFGQVWAGTVLSALPYIGLVGVNGDAGQATWSYLTTYHPTQAIPYSNTAYACGKFNLGNSSTMPNVSLEISGIFANQQVGPISDPTTIMLAHFDTNIVDSVTNQPYVQAASSIDGGTYIDSVHYAPLTGNVGSIQFSSGAGTFYQSHPLAQLRLLQTFQGTTWTVEGWFAQFDPSLSGNRTLLAFTPLPTIADQPMFKVYWNQPTGTFAWSMTNVSGTSYIDTHTGIAASTWYHFAVVRNGQNVVMYINGTSSNPSGITLPTGSADPAANALSQCVLAIGGTDLLSETDFFSGNVDELRVSNVARYTGSFTRPTAPFALTNYAPVGGVDPNAQYVVSLLHMGTFGGVTEPPNSQNYIDIIPGVTWTVDGSGVYIVNVEQALGLGTSSIFSEHGRLLSNIIPALGNSDFTFEVWIYPVVPSYPEPINLGIFGARATWQTSLGFFLNLIANPTPTLEFVMFNGSGGNTTVSAPLTGGFGQWYSVAVTRQGTTITLWINGLAVSTGTYTGFASSDSALVLGDIAYQTQQYQITTFFGYMCEFRMTVGAARYSGSTYVPQSEPFQSGIVSPQGNESGATVLASDEADVNPAMVIQDLLTNPIYGCGFPPQYIDTNVNFFQCCEASYYKCSPIIDNDRAASDVVSELLQIGVAEAIWSEGLLKIIPYADSPSQRVTAAFATVTYSPPSSASTPQYYLSDDNYIDQGGDDPIKVTRINAYDAYNIQQVNCVNRLNSYQPYMATSSDQASLDTYGPRLAAQIDAPSITIPQIAADLSQLALNRVQNQRNTYEFTLGWQYCLLEPMDLVYVADPILPGWVVRIKKIEEDENGNLQFTGEDYIPNLYNSPTYASSGGSFGSAPGSAGSTGASGANSSLSPSATNTPMLWQPPLSMTAGIPQLWIGLSGGANWGGAQVYISTDGGTTYTLLTSITTPITQGALSAAFPVGSDPDTTDTMSVDLTESLGTLTSVVDSQADLQTTLALLDAELVCFSTATLTAAHKYNCTSYIRRGQNGTPITAHPIGGQFSLIGSGLNVYKLQVVAAYAGATLLFKFASINAQGGAAQSLTGLIPYGITVTFPIGGTAVPTSIAAGYSFDVPRGASYTATGPIAIAGLLSVEGTLAIS